MSNYVNLELDTLGPQGVSVKINEGETTTNINVINLTVSCTDEDLTGYQMKVWGTASCPTEEDAVWSNFVSSNTYLISSTDGLKTISVKLRDDVHNESVTASASIRLLTNRPSIQNLYIGPAKVSLVEGKNLATGAFGFDEKIDAAKVMIVQDINAKHDNQANISIPTTNGSHLEFEDGTRLSSDYLEFEGHECDNIFTVLFNINANDIASVSPGDGVKIIKVFVRSVASGLWSV